MEQFIDFKDLVNNLPGMVYRCLFDRSLTLVFAGGRNAGLGSHGDSEAPDEPYSGLTELIHPIDRDQVMSELHSQLQKSRTFSLEFRLNTTAKAAKWVSNRGQLLVDKNGGRQYLEGFVFDITPLREKMDGLLTKENRLHSIARDINQPAEIINTLASLCLMSLAEDSKHFARLEDKLNKIIDQSERMATLAEKMLLFTQDQGRKTHSPSPNATPDKDNLLLFSANHETSPPPAKPENGCHSQCDASVSDVTSTN